MPTRPSGSKNSAGTSRSAKPTRAPRRWLFKSDPDVFSWEDLWSSPGRKTAWDGVRNYQARNSLREAAPGDGVLFYHSGGEARSGAQPAGVVGVAEVASAARPDPTQFDPRDPHHDPTSTQEEPRWLLVDVRARKALRRAVTLAELKADPALSKMLVVQRGQRLSIQPVTEEEWSRVLELGGLTP